MEPEGSLPHSQVTATCPYPEPARSSPCPHIPLKIHPNIILPIYAWVFQVVSFPQVSPPKPYKWSCNRLECWHGCVGYVQNFGNGKQHSLTTLTEGFSVFFLSCKANARVKLAKSGHGPHLFRIIVFCVVLLIVLCYRLYAVLLLLCCTVICVALLLFLLSYVLIVCTVPLPPGVNPIAVEKYIKYVQCRVV